MAYPHHGGQLQDRDAAATHRAEPCVAAPAGAATAKPCSRRVNAARRAISCFMAAMLVVTMNPVANHLSAFAAPSDAFGGGALNDVPAPQVGETDGSGQGQDAAAEAKEPGEEPDAGPADPAAESNEELAATETPNAAGNGASTAGGAAASEATQEDPAEDAAPSYTTWADVAEAVESGELSGEGFKPVGSGTAEDPYAVATPEAFAWWALLHADADARLDADLDLTERGGEPLPWPGDATLSGELDGAAHAVAFATEGAGLFAEVAAGGAVRWLKLGRTDAEARSAADAGDPVAEVASAAALAGSVAGVNEGEIEGVVNRMPVGFSAGAPADAERSAGGIVARNDGAIADCANLGAVSNDAAAGDSAAAGIAARGTGTVATSYNAGGVKAAQNAAYIMTLLDAEGDYASVVDEATCYLAPGEGAAYEGVSDAGADRPGALTASELADAAARLNAGREGDAAAWSTGDDATNGFPVPGEPKDPDAQPAGDDTPGAAPALLSASPRAATYADWAAVGAAVEAGTVGSKPTEQAVTWSDGTTSTAYVIDTAEQLAWFSYKVKSDGAEFSAKSVQLGADIDLGGLDYAGATEVGADFVNCLKWQPIGTFDWATANSAPFNGRFDGAGFVISNLRISCDEDITYGLFGYVTGGRIERLGIASGCMSGSKGDYSATLVGNADSLTLKNCFSAVDLKTTPESGFVHGGLVASDGSGSVVESCYYAGTAAGSLDPVVAELHGTVSSCYYDKEKAPNGSSATATAKNTADMKSRDTIALLNGSGGATVWDVDSKRRNNGYPVVLRAGEPVAPASWEEVGKQVEEGAAGMPAKPTKDTVTWGDGTTDQAYVIHNAEQLAWFAYKLNTGGFDFMNENVQLADDIDLSGFAYNGNTETGAEYENCLPWKGMAVDGYPYRGHFDGAGHEVRNMRLEGTVMIAGFVRLANGAVFERLVLASGFVNVGSGSNVGLVAPFVAVAVSTTIRNCASLVDVGGGEGTQYTSGFVASADASSPVSNCYYAGTASPSLTDVFGTVAAGSNLYYDADKNPSAKNAASGAVGKTTAAMKSKATVELLNGSAATAAWDIDTKNRNGGYPVVLRDGELPAPTSWEEAGKQMEAGAASMPAKPTAQEVTLSGGGTGTAYVIENAEQLAWFSYMMRTKAADLATQNVQLAADIDLAGLNYTGADAVADDYSNCLEWLPIAGGNSGTSYSGTFDGAGKVVRNLSVNQSDMKNLGLIGSASGATVQDVGLESGRLVGKGYLGGLIGYTTGVVKVSDCWNAASIVRTGTSTYEHAGGLVGGNETAGSSSTHVEIARCYNKGSVYSTDTAGDSALGGVAGYVPGCSVITDCYNTGSVSGAHQTGGVVGGGGTGSSGSSNYTRVTNCYNTGIVERGGQANGAVAAWRSKLSNCYTLPGSTENQWEVPVAPTHITEAQLKSWGAAYQLNGGDGVKAFADAKGTWRTDTANANGGYPVLCASGESMASASTWNDVGQWIDVFAPGSRPVETMGTFEISTPQALAWFAYKVGQEAATYQAKSITLASDIDLRGASFGASAPRWVAIPTFTGTFDGSGHAITNMTAVGAAYDNTALIKNLTNGTVKNLSVSATLRGWYVGCIAVTANNAAIQDCTANLVYHSTSSEHGGYYIGRAGNNFGRVAWNATNGTAIERCLGTGSISDLNSSHSDKVANGRGGGIAGRLDARSTIRDCANQGSLSPSRGTCLGGIAGQNDGTIENCYNIASLNKRWPADASVLGDIAATGSGTVRNCYASTNYTAGDSTNDDGSVKLKHLTAAQMQTRGFAVNLNGNMSGAGTAWTWNTGDTYPTFGELPTVDWRDVGGFVYNDEGAFGSFKPATGTGSTAAPLQVSAPEALAYIGYAVTEKTTEASPDAETTWQHVNFDLAADIDLAASYGGAETKWVPISDLGNGFYGTFDGQGHAVRNLTSDEGGLFSSFLGTARNVRLEKSNISGSSVVGSLAGNVVEASVSNCSAAADVSVHSSGGKAGGLLGSVKTTTVTDCWSRASVKSDTGDASGFVANIRVNDVTFSNCYAAPVSVEGASSSNGFGSFDYSFTLSSVGNCYWQTASGLQAVSGGVIGGGGLVEKTELEMRSQATVLLLNATRMGADAPWTWNPFKNSGYPILGKPPVDTEIKTWGAVGALQSEGELRLTEASVDANGYGTMGAVRGAQPSGGDYVPALEGSGTEADPYVVRTPEALAWWGGQVNHNTYGLTHGASGADTATQFAFSHVRVGAALDLAGLSYTGASEAGANHVNCLEWSPITYYDGVVEIGFSGVFDGGGYPIANVRLVGRADNNTGFFGDFESSPTIRRVLLASGTLDATGASAGYEVGTLAAYGSGGSVTDCASLVDVVGSAPAGSSFGGLVGSTSGIAVSNCYYGGSIDPASPAKPFLGDGGSSSAPVNCYYAGDDAADPCARGVASDQLKSWGAAYALNAPLNADGTQKALGDLKTWRAAKDTDGDGKLTSADENRGFPVPVKDGDAAGMQPAADWGDVGLWVDAFGTDDASDKAHPLRPQENGAHAWRDGASGAAFELSSPEQLAWFAYKTNSDSTFMSKNAAITADIDLAGFEYTGKSDVEANNKYAGCLTWVPIGATAAYDKGFSAHFDGGGFLVRNIRIVDDSDTMNLGLFGYTTGAHIERVGLASGAMVLNACLAGTLAAGVEGANIGSAEYGLVEDCFSKVDVYDAPAAVDHMEQGGLIGNQCGAHVRNCYYAGTIEADLVLRYTVAMNEDGDFTNVLFAGRSDADDLAGDPIPADQLAGWGGAYQLNAPLYKDADGVQRQKPFADLGTWREDTENVNGGYPVLVRDAESDSLAHLRAATDWGEVGAWVDTFSNTKNPDYFPDYDGGMEPEKPAEIDVPASWGAPAGTKAYALESPEDLAWFLLYCPPDGASSFDAVVMKPIDLAGGAYTGKSGTGTNFDACLEWSSGAISGSVFDGGGQPITNLYQRKNHGGLFSTVNEGATVRNVALQSGMINSYQLSGPAGTLASFVMSSTIENCFSRAGMKNDDGSVPGAGFVGYMSGSQVKGSYFAGSIAGNASSCFYSFSDSTGTLYTDLDVPDEPGVQKLTTAQLKSWRGAYLLNGSSYVGKSLTDDSTVSSTAWTTDAQANGMALKNDGYPVFGNLELAKLVASVDPNDVLLPAAPGSADPAKKVSGRITTPLGVASPLVGTVELVDVPTASTGLALSDPADVDAGFSTWGTESANAKVAVTAGSASLGAASAGTILDTDGLASVEVHAAAAYDAIDARTVRFVAMDATTGYEVAVTIKGVTEKTLDVTVPVESGASFELAPDGALHEGVMAKEASAFKVNNFVPVAGEVSSVTALSEGATVAYSDGSTATVSAELAPTSAELSASAGAITDADKVRLFVGSTTGAETGEDLTPLLAPLYYDPSKNTVPLSFSVPGGKQVVWKWGMDYTGTFLEPDGVFGFSMGYSFGLPATDVPAAKLEEKA